MEHTSTLRIGDSQKVYQLKNQIENIENKIKGIKQEIGDLQNQSASLSHGILKKEINRVVETIKQLDATRPKTLEIKKKIEALSKKNGKWKGIRISGRIQEKTLIQGRYSQLLLPQDYHNITLQEVLNRETKKWEIQIL